MHLTNGEKHYVHEMTSSIQNHEMEMEMLDNLDHPRISKISHRLLIFIAGVDFYIRVALQHHGCSTITPLIGVDCRQSRKSSNKLTINHAYLKSNNNYRCNIRIV